MADDAPRKGPVREHIDRCVELYGMPIDANMAEPVTREEYEQMRADLLMLVGIAYAQEVTLNAQPRLPHDR